MGEAPLTVMSPLERRPLRALIVTGVGGAGTAAKVLPWWTTTRLAVEAFLDFHFWLERSWPCTHPVEAEGWRG